MFIWLGKSDLPVATIFAPASLASQGQISGIGLAQAKSMESFAMLATHLFFHNIRARLCVAIDRIGAFEKDLRAALDIVGIGYLCKVPLYIVLTLKVGPLAVKDSLLSAIRIFLGLTPAVIRILAVATFAAPDPRKLTLMSSIFFPVNLRPL